MVANLKMDRRKSSRLESGSTKVDSYYLLCVFYLYVCIITQIYFKRQKSNLFWGFSLIFLSFNALPLLSQNIKMLIASSNHSTLVRFTGSFNSLCTDFLFLLFSSSRRTLDSLESRSKNPRHGKCIIDKGILK